jgi:hypothetical protein
VTVIQDYAASGTTSIGGSILATVVSAVQIGPRPIITRATPTPRPIPADILASLRRGLSTPEGVVLSAEVIGPPPFGRAPRARRPIPRYSEEEVREAAARLAPPSGGTIAPLWPATEPGEGPSSGVFITGGDAPVTLRVTADRAMQEPLLVRLTSAGAGDLARAAALPAGASVTGFKVELLRLDGTAVERHPKPLEICVQVPEAQLAAAQGDLTRLAILRLDPGSGQYERLPAASRAAEGLICATTVETSTFAVGVLPTAIMGRPVADPRFFTETGYRIGDDAIWNYFQRRGGLRAFGYPISRQFRLYGTDVQFFQRRVLQRLPDGTVQQLNILDETLFPFRRVNGSTFPSADPVLLAAAPQPSDPEYATKALQFVREHAVLGFDRAYFSTVTCADAYPGSPCSEDMAALLNLEMWGLPISPPVLDPAHRTFAYQAFQRGILHYDFDTDTTEGILLGDWWKSLITGEGLPSDLESDAMSTPFWRQFNPAESRTGMWWPEEVQDTNMVAAFAVDLPRERIQASALATSTPREG